MGASDPYRINWPSITPESAEQHQRNNQYLEQLVGRFPLGFGLVWSSTAGAYVSCPVSVWTDTVPVIVPIGESRFVEGGRINELGQFQAGAAGLWEIRALIEPGAVVPANSYLGTRIVNVTSGEVTLGPHTSLTTSGTLKSLVPMSVYVLAKPSDRFQVSLFYGPGSGTTAVNHRVRWFTARNLRTL